MENAEEREETNQEEIVEDVEIANEDGEHEEPEENLTEEELELASSAHRDKLDWVKLRTIIHSKPKELDSTSKLSEDDIYNMLIGEQMHGDLAKMLSSMSLVAFDKHMSGSIVWRQFEMTENSSKSELITRRLKWIFKLLNRSGSDFLQVY